MDLTDTIGTFPSATVEAARKRWKSLLLDYCLSNYNKTVGSQTGGNSLYFLILSSYEHKLATYANFTVGSNEIYWDPTWLETTSLKDIRAQVDAQLASVRPPTMLPAISLHYLFERSREHLKQGPNEQLMEYYRENAQYLPEVEEVLAGKNPNILHKPLFDQMLVITLACAKYSQIHDNLANLGKEDEAGKSAEFDALVRWIVKFETPVLLFAIRNMIGLARVVMGKLDDHAVMDQLINKIADELEGK